MSEFKGTPGPWVWSNLSEDENSLRGAGGRIVFWGDNIPSGLHEDDGWAARIGATHSDDESQSNANLIAAAPDLLNVLTMGQTMQTPEFLHWIADRLVYVHGENANSDFIISLRKRADAAQVAIHKALGTN